MKRKSAFFFTLFFLISFKFIEAKILIFTYSYNRPDFIELQNKTFKKFFLDDYEFVVFNDAVDPAIYNDIRKVCQELHIKCIDIPQEIHSKPYLVRWPGEPWNSPNVRNANVVMYSLNEHGFHHNDIVMSIDSDMFLVKPFSVRDYLKDNLIAGVEQTRNPDIRYLWVGLVFIDMAHLPDKNTLNLNCGQVNGVPVDVGGQTHHYMKNHADVPVKFIDISNSRYDSLCPFSDKIPLHAYLTGEYLMHFYADGAWLHYGRGSNWDGLSSTFHSQKTQLLHQFIDLSLSFYAS